MKIPLWFRLCFCGGESTKTVFLLELWEEDPIAAAFIGHKRRGQPFLIKVSRAPLHRNLYFTFFLPQKNEHSNVCVLIILNIRGRQPVGLGRKGWERRSVWCGGG